jgi:peptide/nickel transport system substrate-binding protein
MKDKFIEIQKAKLIHGQIDRRQFVMSVLAAGVALPAALGFAHKAVAATPIRGGRFRMGIAHGSTTDTLDSATSENHYTLINGYTFGNHLTEVGADGELRGELAESYESTDAQKWVFNLRQGVEFHNGKTMTSEDVVASFNHHMGEDSTSAA